MTSTRRGMNLVWLTVIYYMSDWCLLPELTCRHWSWEIYHILANQLLYACISSILAKIKRDSDTEISLATNLIYSSVFNWNFSVSSNFLDSIATEYHSACSIVRARLHGFGEAISNLVPDGAELSLLLMTTDYLLMQKAILCDGNACVSADEILNFPYRIVNTVLFHCLKASISTFPLQYCTLAELLMNYTQ